ncbi:cytidylyltransferase domain-containing protein [Nesterenkonia sphaerica]|uniref:Acylneuraminate cytidylyltransferase family protein n=1 Tax=Nesterenkonia sphaerica TaxID=1804988 RepID=A0A5R9ABQ3_9MICC|nr:acylneuraminate cytidylyltransferase family protein [Nesterenkonia sphaerica]TLP75564.1 acylneuraminate cytidylyltransferase family protein [Nesterenkonia sphaerica]
METDPIVAVVPCRAGSERVANKNTRPFAGFDRGLLELKLTQLAAVEELAEIIVSTNDPVVSEYAARFSTEQDQRVTVVQRPDELGRSSTPMSEFIQYLGRLREDGTMLMTHVTHPLLAAAGFRDLISRWRTAAADGHDSLLTVTKLHAFLWDADGKPFNYDAAAEKWPRSQDIPPLFEVNHAAYLIPFRRVREVGDRVGERPFMHEMSGEAVMDIDWEDQFQLLNDLANAKQMRGLSLI